ncbi:hypothetical protein PACTADRAFT_69742 [Pachysolen tannophilus NRRL Y-2460]|uniref:Serine/threonine-protein kinase BUR1 n=1 Tax=Pachysolen tannophilus NRRL Y-2460 TaxID=669874 RepID=A0A1E4TSN3_PACTA|nr:hypothetical protein PACTADRAFT_69742 [Pachysolen tannophilus NRRL Y-2460]
MPEGNDRKRDIYKRDSYVNSNYSNRGDYGYRDRYNSNSSRSGGGRYSGGHLSRDRDSYQGGSSGGGGNSRKYVDSSSRSFDRPLPTGPRKQHAPEQASLSSSYVRDEEKSKRPRKLGDRGLEPDLMDDKRKNPRYDSNPKEKNNNNNNNNNNNSNSKKASDLVLPRGPRKRFNRDNYIPHGKVRSFTEPVTKVNARNKLGFDDEEDEEDEDGGDNYPETNHHHQYDKPAQRKLFLEIQKRTTPIYERIQQVGEGTYGKVYKAKNRLTDKLVALKRLRLESEREGFPITAMREIRLLQSFQHENVSSLTEMMVEKNSIYMIFEYMEHDLTGLLTHPAVDLTLANKKYLFKQLLTGINYLHEKRIMHRDIKGSNILIDKFGTLKITDFGLARKMKNIKPDESPDYTNRVITLWYRPPELLLGATDYGREVDIWGIGCLLIELFTKKAIFQGANEISQLQSILKIMGTPTYQEWPEMDDLLWYHILKPEYQKRKFNELYNKVLLDDENCIKLCEDLLQQNPAKRITAKEALEYEWFKTEPLEEKLSLEGLEEMHEYEIAKITAKNDNINDNNTNDKKIVKTHHGNDQNNNNNNNIVNFYHDDVLLPKLNKEGKGETPILVINSSGSIKLKPSLPLWGTAMVMLGVLFIGYSLVHDYAVVTNVETNVKKENKHNNDSPNNTNADEEYFDCCEDQTDG